LSDVGYSTNNSYWNTAWDSAIETSWIYEINNYSQFLINPSSLDTYGSSSFLMVSIEGNFGTLVRPCLNLVSSASIDLDRLGSETDPYILVLE